MCVSVWVCAYVITEVWWSEEGIGSPERDVPRSELLALSAGNQTQVLRPKQDILLTSEPSLQPQCSLLTIRTSEWALRKCMAIIKVTG